jgi:nuclear pore complex protein Nup160
MYQRARRIRAIIGKSSAGLNELASDELEAYMIAINALSLVDLKNAWIVVPRTANVTQDNV